MANSFNRDFIQDSSRKQEKGVIKIGPEGGIPIKVHEDGTVEARGFIDSSDNLNLFKSSSGKVLSRTKVTDSTSAVLDVTSGKQVYNSIKSFYLKLQNIFRSYSLPMRTYSHVQYFRFGFLSKKLKKIATDVIASGSRFIFHFQKGDKVYSKKTASNFATKIYSVPVSLKFSDSFRNLNDLVVVKTGAFNYAGAVRSGFASGSERIVYVSPHEEMSGVAYYKTTGSFSHLGTGSVFSTYSGASGNGDLLQATNYYYLSSKNYEFPSGYSLAGGSTYYRIDENGNSALRTGSASLTGTQFYSLYTGELTKTKVNTGVWDGVIPAYTPFKIELWSVNAEKIGFEGNIDIAPTANYSNLNIEILGGGVGFSDNANLAEIQAIDSAKFSCVTKADSALVKIGAIPSGSKLRKYVKFIEGQVTI